MNDAAMHEQAAASIAAETEQPSTMVPRHAGRSARDSLRQPDAPIRAAVRSMMEKDEEEGSFWPASARLAANKVDGRLALALFLRGHLDVHHLLGGVE